MKFVPTYLYIYEKYSIPHWLNNLLTHQNPYTKLSSKGTYLNKLTSFVSDFKWNNFIQ